MIGALLRALGKLVRPKTPPVPASAPAPAPAPAPSLAPGPARVAAQAPTPMPERLAVHSADPVPAARKVSLPPIATVTPLAHPVRAPAIAPAIAATYWKEALNFLDLKQVAAIGKDEIKPLLLIEADKIGARGAPQAAEEGEHPQDVFVVLALWSANKAGGFNPHGVRHPLLCLSAYRSGNNLFFPRLDVAPRLNDAYLEPGSARRAFSLGNGDDLNGDMLAQFGDLQDDETLVPGWHGYWDMMTQFLVSALDADGLSGLEALLARRANEIDDASSGKPKKKARAAAAGAPPKYWKLAAAVYPSERAAVRQIERIYDSLLHAMEAYPAETALFRQLCRPAETVSVRDIPDTARARMLGHIDEYEKDGRRSLFPLDPTQRQAVHAILGLRQGEIQAVNGPPGSGKTSMLRAVVASLWVEAAMRNAPECPIIVACGGTNQSVTNVIEAFGSAPHLGDGLQFARRWIEGASSYGAYLPAGSVLAKNKDKLKDYVCLKWANNGFLWAYANRENILLPARSFEFESIYTDHARRIWAGAVTVEDTVALINTKLRELDQKSREFLLAVAQRANWEALGAAFLAGHAACWTGKRRDEADIRLARLRADSGDLAAAEEFVDLTWRAESFHWAARYWEGRFLLAQRTRLLSRHPKNVEEALRRVCMITPCIVSTMHTVGQLAAIDQEVGTYATERTHAFGLFDLLVVDEAGQALTSLGAAAFALAKTAAVVGDLKQLAPISRTTALSELAIAKRAGAREELEGIVSSQRSVASGSVLGMAKLVSRYTDGPDPGVSLLFHYRCKPSIIAFCSMLCYNETLVPRTDESEPFPEPALGWVDVDATPDSLGGSFRNIPEANEIVEWIAQRWPEWQRHKATRGKKLQELVAIVTPYAAQSAYLETAIARTFNALREKNPSAWPCAADVADLTIGTVHRLQGAERPIVCFSLVEGPGQNGASFIDRDRSMLNVAVSRAKRAFLIFGHPGRLFGRPGAPEDPKDQQADPSHRLGRYLRACDEAQRLYPKQLVLIEAQGKLASMSQILGKGSLVAATSGALTRLLPGSGVDIDAGFVPRPTPEKRTPAVLATLRAALLRVEAVCLATDDDRMGEYIAWQAQRLLRDEFGARPVRRVRLGGITRKLVNTAFADPQPIDEHKVMAEIVREIVDCIVTERFTAAARRAGLVPRMDARAQAFVTSGALTLAQAGKIADVGRVQAAVLRLLYERAIEVGAQADSRRIQVTANLAGTRIVGEVVRDGRDRFGEDEARQLQVLLAGASLALAAQASHSAPAEAPAASTVALLAHAWSRHALAPAEALASLQSLYDGSWAAGRADYDPIDPIEPARAQAGHPPVAPLDRADTPLRLKPVLGETDFKMYSLVWDFFQIAQTARLTETLAEAEFDVRGQPGLRLRFRAGECRGLAPELSELMMHEPGASRPQTVTALQAALFSIPQAGLSFALLSAAEWDMRPDTLLRRMEQRQIGRPSTFVAALASLERRKLIAFPRVAGCVRLTPDGLATALALEDEEPRLSDPDFSFRLSTMLASIETGLATPRDVLESLMPTLAPAHNPLELAPKIWSSLAELAQRIDAADSPAGNASVTKISGEPGAAVPSDP